MPVKKWFSVCVYDCLNLFKNLQFHFTIVDVAAKHFPFKTKCHANMQKFFKQDFVSRHLSFKRACPTFVSRTASLQHWTQARREGGVGTVSYTHLTLPTNREV